MEASCRGTSVSLVGLSSDICMQALCRGAREKTA